MNILFRDSRLRKRCNDYRKLQREYGEEMAKVIRRRLDDLYAAPNLQAMRGLAGRCHELGHDRAGQISLDLRGQYRLLFVSAHDPCPVNADGGLDWSRVTAIEVIGVEDTHE